jgi:hypothetical protein
MLLDIDTFRRRTQYDLDGLVNDLVRETHRATPAELTAWRNSLPSVAAVLAHDSLRGFHIHLGERGRMVVEYRLPSSAFWADLVLLGRGREGPSAVVVELKDWNTQGDKAGARENLVARLLAEEQPDVLCLQECKSPVEKMPLGTFAALGYHHVVARGQKGYNGVAILSRLPITDAGEQDFARLGHARHVAARLENGVTIHNCYVPAGGDIPDRMVNDKFGQKLALI